MLQKVIEVEIIGVFYAYLIYLKYARLCDASILPSQSLRFIAVRMTPHLQNHGVADDYLSFH